VDHALAAYMSSSRLGKSPVSGLRKGNKQVLEWDDDMETMQREKNAAEAMRDLKSRLRGSSEIQSPALPPSSRVKREKSPIADQRALVDEHKGDDMEAFLDDLLG